jgi:hypothetical protein
MALPSLHDLLQTALFSLLGVAALYVLYVIKARVGIDIFPEWGLHLYGPRSLVRWLVSEIRRLAGA